MVNDSAEKPVRLYFESYLQIVRNSVGSNLFRNFYVRTSAKGKFDAFNDGENSCAFFVSAILVIFKKLSGFHGIVDSVIKDLERSGWQKVQKPQAGDVLVWEAMQFDDAPKQHIGFYIGDSRAISTSWIKKTPVEHEMNFGEAKRKITHVFRMAKWEEAPEDDA